MKHSIKYASMGDCDNKLTFTIFLFCSILYCVFVVFSFSSDKYRDYKVLRQIVDVKTQEPMTQHKEVCFIPCTVERTLETFQFEITSDDNNKFHSIYIGSILYVLYYMQ